MKKALATIGLLILLLATAAYLFVVYPLRDPHPPEHLAQGTLAIRNANLYISPDVQPLHNATLLARDGRIVAVGTNIPIPPDAQVIPCQGCTVTAGFWNTHVHFTQPKWLNAAFQPAAKLNAALADMLTSRGFTTVVDTGSDLRVTVSLRRRIESGDLRGPFLYTAGGAIYPENGTPYYLRDTLPKYILKLLAQPRTPDEAARDEERNIRSGADILKLFTGSIVEPNQIKPMRQEIAQAAVAVAHRHGQLAFAHESNLEGIRVALASGVDVLAHAPSSTRGINDALMIEMANKAAMIPTLKMFANTVTTDPDFLDPIESIVRRFHAAGGTLLFGTDVGYMTDYNTGDEFAALARCGLAPMDVLRMLTTAPAAIFHAERDKGTLAPGKLADFVVLAADPAHDVQAFAQVQTTVRAGQILWSAPPR